MSDDKIGFWGIMFAVVVILFGGGYYVVSCNDCNARGGVLIQDASGLYKCVPEAPK